MNKVIVFGSRTWTDRATIKRRLEQLPPGTTIVHGQSPGGGADLLADEVARELGFAVIPVPISDDDHQRARMMGRPKFAPIARNERMGREHADADQALGFWDGKSPGSKNMITVCKRLGIPVEIIPPDW